MGDPNIYHFLDMKEFFYYNNHLYIVTEELGESLLETFIEPKVAPRDSELKTILKCIFQTLDFLWEAGIFHCDIKPENILFYKDSQKVKLIDFGSASFCDEDDFYYLQTKPYRAPEMVMGERYDYSIDIWSVGCIIYELVTFNILFYYRNPVENLMKALAINKHYDITFYKKGSIFSKNVMNKKFFF